MNKAIAVTTVLLVSAGVFAWAWAARQPEEDTQVEEMKEMIHTTFSQESENEDETVEEKAKRFQALGKMAESLTTQQSLKLAETFIPMMIKRRESELDKFFALPPEQQREELDKRIDEMEQWRAYGERRRQEREATSANSGATGSQTDATANQDGQQRPRGPWSKFSKDDRERMRRLFMDSTSPKTRARFQEHRRMLNARRQERGMEPVRRGF